MRALYQRRKGRDLFDLAIGLANRRSDAGRIVAAFREYTEREGNLPMANEDPTFLANENPTVLA